MSTQTVQLLSRIEEPHANADAIAYEWEVTDSFGEFSRAFSINYRATHGLQPGDQVDLAAGYDTNRLTLCSGLVDEVTKTTDPGAVNFVASGRDLGAREIASVKITNTWVSIPGDTALNVPPITDITQQVAFPTYPSSPMPTAHQIIFDVAKAIGCGIDVLEFPNYALYNTYVAVGKTLLEIVQELTDPWNLFARVQYMPVIRNKRLSVLKIDWQNPPTGGCSITRSYLSQVSRHQTLYLDAPRLNEVSYFVIKGAAYKKLAPNLGIQTTIEYQRNKAQTDTNNTFAGQVNDLTGGGTVTPVSQPGQSADVVVETVTITRSYCDKVLTRDQKTYSNSHGVAVGITEESTSGLTLIHENKESFFYINGGDPSLQIAPDQFNGTDIPMNPDDVQVYSQAPDQNSLLWIATSKQWGFQDNAAGQSTFQEIQRDITQYYYDLHQQVAQEVTASQKLDDATNQWGVTTLTIRNHSQITGNTVRTNFNTFTFDNSIFKLSVADHQTVAGVRPDFRTVSPRGCVVTVQAQSPQGEVDQAGHVIDPGQGKFIFTYSNPYLGQSETDTIYANALVEQAFQLEGWKWEDLSFEGPLNPALHQGKPISLELESGTFVDCVVLEVKHLFSTNEARSVGTARRLTRDAIT